VAAMRAMPPSPPAHFGAIIRDTVRPGCEGLGR
jgi:hypothetical protein